MNSFGRIFRVSIYGESHGSEVGVLIDSCPPGIKISIEDFLYDIARRSTKNNLHASPRKEKDIPIIKSGIYNGITTGAPILIAFKNENIISNDYDFHGFLRPGHADFTASKKYKDFNDPRGGGHFSGRLTLPIVAAGVIAKKIIDKINISAEISEVGGLKDYEKYLEQIALEKDSVGAKINCIVKNVGLGLGEPFFNSIESNISAAIFSIPGVKAIEFGNGISAAKMKGSEFNDVIINKNGTTLTNNSGGINGGISNGSDIEFNVYIKPTSSIGKSQMTYNFNNKSVQKFDMKGRHDVCFGLRVPPVIEAITAIVLADFYLINKTNL